MVRQDLLPNYVLNCVQIARCVRPPRTRAARIDCLDDAVLVADREEKATISLELHGVSAEPDPVGLVAKLVPGRDQHRIADAAYRSLQRIGETLERLA